MSDGILNWIIVLACPLRNIPDILNYEENLKYIIHLRNPLDILISQYYSWLYP